MIMPPFELGYTHQVGVLTTGRERRLNTSDRHSTQIPGAGHSDSEPTSSRVPWCTPAKPCTVVYVPQGRFVPIHRKAPYRLARALETLITLTTSSLSASGSVLPRCSRCSFSEYLLSAHYARHRSHRNHITR